MFVPAVLCFSHLRWDDEGNRPIECMRRCARDYRVFYIEEPVLELSSAWSEITHVEPRMWRVVPHLPRAASEDDRCVEQQRQLALLCCEHRILRPMLWFYTPAALPITRYLARTLTVYDRTKRLERRLVDAPELAHWDLVLTEQADLVFGEREHATCEAAFSLMAGLVQAALAADRLPQAATSAA